MLTLIYVKIQMRIVVKKPVEEAISNILFFENAIMICIFIHCTCMYILCSVLYLLKEF